MIDLSIVVPVYGCELSLKPLRDRVASSLEGITQSWELILVNDGSTDGGWETISELVHEGDRIIGIDLSRNFGQHSAINAGLEYSSGRYVVVMDCDLQDRPEEIPRLWSAAQQGFDVVVARRENRKDPIVKRFLSLVFHRAMGFLTGQQFDPAVANFGCYQRRVIDAVLAMGDVSRSFPLFVRWVGFPTTAVDVQHDRREFGSTTYSFRKGLKLALGAMMTFSDRPLRMVVSLGLWLSMAAGVVAFGYFVGAIRGAFEVEGWATVVISIWLLAGIVIMIQGVVGLYVSKIFDQTKERPLYVVREVLSDSKTEI
jgi:polyisoprenyl-phosphate glycosyltransferase